MACATADVGKNCPTGGECLNTFCLGDDGGTMTLPQCVPGLDAGARGSDAGLCTPEHPCGVDQLGCTCAVAQGASRTSDFALCLLLLAILAGVLSSTRRLRNAATRTTTGKPCAENPHAPV